MAKALPPINVRALTRQIATALAIDQAKLAMMEGGPMGARKSGRWGGSVSHDSDLHVVLCQPEIPPNTGNIIRLCANTGMSLHIIEPLGFELDDTRLRRAGLDYHEYADIQTWRDLASYQQQFPQRRLIAVETSGRQSYASFRFELGDSLLFGSETSGLSAHTLASLPTAHVLKVPMMVGSRSLNLSNTVAVVVYEAWRQLGFHGSE